MGKTKALCINKDKGRKFQVDSITLLKDTGVKGDFHAKGGERQVSLLASKSIEAMRKKGLKLDNGAFGENIVTEGIDLMSLKIGQRIKIGEAELEITRIGKECQERCSIYYSAGDCVMPKEGVFAKVVTGGIIKPGDKIDVIEYCKRL